MKSRGVACSVGLGVALVVAACRQLVGIEDRSVAIAADGGPVCGLVVPDQDCRACAQRECCSAAAACGASSACAANEDCVAACGTDEDCVGACQYSEPVGTVAAVPAFDTCVSSRCSGPCQIQCGAHTGFVSSPDAGAACEACIASNACPEAQSCGASLACETLYRCEVSCSTLDCTNGCYVDDAGTGLFLAYGKLLTEKCTDDCQLGQSWLCVGTVIWPEPKATSLAVEAIVADALSGSPTADAGVKLCEKDDQGCLQPLDDQPTDENGAVTLHYSLANTIQGGLNGYLLVTSPAITTSLFFWGFPLSEPVANFGIKVNTVAAGSLPAFLAVLGATQVAGHGQVFVGALDCRHNPAVGVHVRIVSGSDANTETFYSVGGGETFSMTAEGTDITGAAVLVNVPAGPAQIEIVTGSGLVVSQVSFLVVDGTVASVVALPTPM